MGGLDLARPKPAVWHETVPAGEQETQSYASPGMESTNFMLAVDIEFLFLLHHVVKL